ncbi:MAG: hypothetical protein ABH956_01810 [Candidatus Nealsonbacteria bacterium]
MKKIRLLLTLGIWTMTLSYLGFPLFWKNLIFTVTGLVLCYLSFIFYKEARKRQPVKKEVFDNFSENQNFSEIKIEPKTELNNTENKV